MVFICLLELKKCLKAISCRLLSANFIWWLILCVNGYKILWAEVFGKRNQVWFRKSEQCSCNKNMFICETVVCVCVKTFIYLFPFFFSRQVSSVCNTCSHLLLKLHIATKSFPHSNKIDFTNLNFFTYR